MNTRETDCAQAMMTALDPGAFFAGGAFGAAASPACEDAGPKERRGLRAVLRLLNPGDLLCDLVGAQKPDDRTVLRMFVNLGARAKIAVLIVLMFID